ncbi:MAG: hypothetical protein DRP45_00775 [Candidatus Zixiibacteriota bacterium]|nr:MAG: hypothetical protein DRP45_00775 [candidate division Zixibacteria bacterium]
MHSDGLQLIRLYFVAAMIVAGSISLAAGQAIVVDHNSVGQFESISAATFDQIRANYNFFYGRASHGRQLIDGQDMLAEESSTFARLEHYRVSADLGYLGSVDWVVPMRTYLDSHPECNRF